MTVSTELSENKKTYFDQIDILKGIAIFLVVLGHSIIVYPIDLHQYDFCDFLYRWLSSVHMPLFFLISGFLFSYKQNYGKYILGKVKRLVVPYVVFNAINIFPRAFLQNFINKTRDIGESLYEVVFYGGDYWFLYTLFIIFFIYPIIYRIIHEKKDRTISVLLIDFVVYLLMPDIGIFTLKKVVYYLLFFMAGNIIRDYIGDKIFNLKINKGIKLIAMAVLLGLWIFMMGTDFIFSELVVGIIGCCFFVLFVQCDLSINIFKNFGKYSLQLYLLNGVWLVISRTIIVKILGVTNPALIICFNMFVCFFISYLIIRYICSRIKPVRFMMGMKV
ncbi:MAG: acyltransferase family protein [Erysipelotrichaceae bacterium]|nr:acyltransferase family protein [Erysipelotrichaceae bacterium]